MCEHVRAVRDASSGKAPPNTPKDGANGGDRGAADQGAMTSNVNESDDVITPGKMPSEALSV